MVPGGSTTTMFTRLPCGKRMSNLTLPTLAVGCCQGFQGDDKAWGSARLSHSHFPRISCYNLLVAESHRLVHLLVRAGAGTVQVAGHLCSIVEAVLLHTRIKHCCQNQVAFMCIWIIWYHLVSRIICDIRHDTGALEFGRPEVPKAHHWLWHAMACCPELSAARLLQHGSSLSSNGFPWACLYDFICCNNCPQCSTWHDHWSNAFARSIKTWPESMRWKTNVSGTKTPEKNNSLSFQQPCIAAAIKKCEAMHSQRLYLQWSWKMERNVSPTADHWTPTAWSMAVA